MKTVVGVLKAILGLFLIFCYTLCTIGLIGLVTMGNLYMISQWGTPWYIVWVLVIFIIFTLTSVVTLISKHKGSTKGTTEGIKMDKDAEDTLDEYLSKLYKLQSEGNSLKLSQEKMDKEKDK